MDEKKGYATLAVIALLMVMNFYLFVAPHPSGASSYTAKNGTIYPVPKGEVAVASGDGRQPIVFDLFLIAGLWSYAIANLVSKLRKQNR
jgi:hypothetical protein